MKQLMYPLGVAVLALLVPATAGLAQARGRPTRPAANASAASPTGSVRVPLAEGFAAYAPLWVYSAERGGLRTGHSGLLRPVGQALTFWRAYPFRPGEVVRAGLRATGPAPYWQWQFTVAVGGTGQGSFRPAPDLPTPNLAPALALGDIDNDGDVDLLTASATTGQAWLRLNGGDARGSATGLLGGGSDPAVGAALVGMALADVDDDGDLDLLATSPTTGRVHLRLNQPWVRDAIPVPTDLPVPTPLPGNLLAQAYPNPAPSCLAIGTNQTGPATLLLADALGRPLSKQQLVLEAGTTIVPLAGFAHLSAGMYLLRVRQGGRQSTVRVMQKYRALCLIIFFDLLQVTCFSLPPFAS